MKRLAKNLFVRNWILKLLSLLLAIILWLTLIPEEKTFSERTLTIPLETHNIPSDVELVEKPASAVDITIRAPNRLINQISPENVKAILNLEKASVNQEDYPLNPEMISIPPEAKVLKIFPNKVHLKFEKTKEVLMEVAPVIIGKVQDEFKVEKIEIIPSTVLIKGPESRIRIKDKVRTSPIDISQLSQSAEFEADLIPPKADLRLATSQTKVKIKIILSEKKL